MNNLFMLENVIELKNESNEVSSWLTGTLTVDSNHMIPHPDTFKILVPAPVSKTEIGSEYALLNEDVNYLCMLPYKDNSSIFLGADCNSATLFYGKTSEIEKLKIMIDQLLINNYPSMMYQDFSVSGFSYMSWDLENNKTFLILHNDQQYGIYLSDEIKALNLLMIESGGNADDILATELLLSYLINDLKVLTIDNELDDDYINQLIDEKMHMDYIKIANQEITDQDKSLIIEFSKVIMNNILKEHESPHEFTASIAKRVQLL